MERIRFCLVGLGLNLVLVLVGTLAYSAPQAGSPAAEELTPAEKGLIEKAQGPEESLKAWISIANDRFKIVLAAAEKGDKEGASQAVTGFRNALTRADDAISQVQSQNRNVKKNVQTFFKATRHYASQLLQVLEKGSEDLRDPLQSALEVVQRIQGGLMIQMEKLGITP